MLDEVEYTNSYASIVKWISVISFIVLMIETGLMCVYVHKNKEIFLCLIVM